MTSNAVGSPPLESEKKSEMQKDAELLERLKSKSSLSKIRSVFGEESSFPAKIFSPKIKHEQNRPIQGVDEVACGEHSEGKQDNDQNDGEEFLTKNMVSEPQHHTANLECEDDAITAAKPLIPLTQSTQHDSGGGFQCSNLPKTVKDDRGGPAEDAELLAALKAISSKSSSDRFRDDTEEENRDNSNVVTVSAKDSITMEKKMSPRKKPQKETSKYESELPPWKKKIKKDIQAIPKADKAVVVATSTNSKETLNSPPSQSPKPEMGGFQSSNLPQTVKDDRGGSAEDAELLAALQAISSKSSNDRFRDESEEENGDKTNVTISTNNANIVEMKTSPRKKALKVTSKDESELPPWKRKGKKTTEKIPNADDVVVVATPEKSIETPKSLLSQSPDQTMGAFQKSDLPKTVKDDRGGSAEDAELLAALRAISSKSGGDRFRDDTEEENRDNANVKEPTEDFIIVEKNVSQGDEAGNDKLKIESELPPWKRKGKNTNNTTLEGDNVVVVATPLSSIETPKSPPSLTIEPASGGFQPSDLPKTVKDDRGGSAEDAELLAALKSISSKSSVDRFRGDTDEKNGAYADVTTSTNDSIREKTISSRKKAPEIFKDKFELPLWEKAEKADQTLPKRDDMVIVAAPETSIEIPETPLCQPSSPEMGGFQSSNLPKTVKDNRGGSAEDAELLAALKAISSKSGGDRFRDETEEENGGNANVKKPSNDFVIAEKETSPRKKASNMKPKAELPPWKRKGKKPTETIPNVDDVVVVASPPNPTETPTPPPSQPPELAMGGFQPADLPKTVKDDRGGSAEDAELLAALKAISSKSGGDRFRDDTEEETGDNAGVTVPTNGSIIREKKVSPRRKASKVISDNKSELPPWKRKGKINQTIPKVDDVDVVTTPPNSIETPKPPPSPMSKTTKGGFQPSDLPKTVKDDRGGSAEDAELLAALKAISSKSGDDRFRDDTEEESGVNSNITIPSDDARIVAKNTSPRKKTLNVTPKDEVELPPWKRKGKKTSKSIPKGDNVVVVATPPNPIEAPKPLPSQLPEPPMGGFQSSNLPKTVKDERGGSAEDAELLAALKAISSKSGGDRFRNDNEDEETETNSNVEDIHQTSRSMKTEFFPSKQTAKVVSNGGRDLPPWKRKANITKQHTSSSMNSKDVVVAAPHGKTNSRQSSTAPETGGFDSGNLPKTVKDDRGGSAEDAELLAALKAISSNSSCGRFRDDTEEGQSEHTTREPAINDSSAVKHKVSPRKTSPNVLKNKTELPPWKRKGKTGNEGHLDSTDVVVSAASQDSVDIPASPVTFPPELGNGVFSSNLPKTVKGDRGGPAEDAELLAALRAVSSKSGSTRFQSETEESEANSSSAVNVPEKPCPDKSNSFNFSVASNDVKMISPDSAPTPIPDDPEISIDDVTDAVASKNWKMRKAAYTLLISKLSGVCHGGSNIDIDSGEILDSVDELVLCMVKDSNAAALDIGLEFAVKYASHCKQATSAEHAARIAASVLKGSSLSSTRPKTTKLSKTLLLKLMEVGADGPSSVHAVIEILLKQGIISRKPKIVVSSADLVLEAAISFGAVFLPLAVVSTNVPKLLTHSNAGVRETGLNIIAEICRAVGSKTPLESVISKLKSAQLTQLDNLLEKQPAASPPTVGLRSQISDNGATNVTPDDMIKALKESSEEEEARRFASRPAVNIFEALPKTEYANKIKEKKWSEKVGALDIIIACGGERPFKLAQPSSSINYNNLISDLRKLLAHSHFAVNSKAMAVLQMLAEGVGEKLYPALRPLLLSLTSLSKDKKLTSAVSLCLDAFFGNVLSFDHLLDKEDAIPDSVNEKKQKNALARKCSIEFLLRCLQRCEKAGPRGKLNFSAGEQIVSLAVSRLSDTDANVRKASLNILEYLLSADIQERIVAKTREIVNSLEQKNPRAFKTLSKINVDSKNKKEKERKGKGPKATSKTKPDSPSKPISTESAVLPRSVSVRQERKPKLQASDQAGSSYEQETSDDNIPSLDDAVEKLSSFSIQKWDADEDDGGILAGLKSSAWKSRRSAIGALVLFAKSFSDSTASPLSLPANELAVFVKHHTKEFKESNFNLTKCIMELFQTLCDVYLNHKKALHFWICKSATTLSVEKLVDRKLSQISSELLLSLCTVHSPVTIASLALKTIETVKSPVSHEALLKWFITFLVDFGALTMNSGMKEYVSWVLTECKSTNLKVRQAALKNIEELHKQLGPVAKALILSSLKDNYPESIRSQIENSFVSSPYDPDESKRTRPRCCVAVAVLDSSQNNSSSRSTHSIQITKTDLMTSLSDDCIQRLRSKEGKTSWKIRKEALQEVSSAVGKCGGLISCTPSSVKSLLELIRALIERLSDSQSNLKPLAASVIASIFKSVEAATQPKLGKIAFRPLIFASMNDNKKPMREACLSALVDGTEKSEFDGGGANTMAMEIFINPFVIEITESEYKAGGLPEIIDFVNERAEYLPKRSSASSTKMQSQLQQLAAQLVGCLTSSKSETRAAAERLLRRCVDVGTISMRDVKKGVDKLLPAQQRTVSPIIKSLLNSCEDSTEDNGRKPRNERNKTSPSSPSQITRRSKSVAKKISSQHDNEEEGDFRKDIVVRTKKSFQSERKLNKSIPGKNFDSQSIDSTNESNPLEIKHTNPSKADRSSSSNRKKDNWPEYPEEPSNQERFQTLKKAWSHIISASTIDILFPPYGMRKQEDAIPGVELIDQSITMLSDNHDDAIIIDQLDLIIKWLVCGLCSREHTAGLQAILNLFQNLFSYLIGKTYQMTDFEASLCLPYILEKASTAKGRFGDLFQEIILHFTSGTHYLYSPQKYGQLICVPLVEKSNTPKSRVLAMRECSTCVSLVGLNAVGKKGIIIIAKTLSEETLSENRTASLDVIETVLKRMGGDVQKLFRVCGKANISPKAKALVEERWARHNMSNESVVSNDSSSSGVKDNVGVVTGTNATKNRYSAKPKQSSPSPSSRFPLPRQPSVGRSGMRSSSPSLNLSRGIQQPSSPANSSVPVSNGPFTFKYNPTENVEIGRNTSDMKTWQKSSPRTGKDSSRFLSPSRPAPHETPSHPFKSPGLPFRKDDAHNSKINSLNASPAGNSATIPVKGHSNMIQTPSKLGAATSLRHRLQQIRDKHRNTPIKYVSETNEEASNEIDDSTARIQHFHLTENRSEVTDEKLASSKEITVPLSNDSSDSHIRQQILAFLNSTVPLEENDPVLSEGTNALRLLHASISKTAAGDEVGESESLQRIRSEIFSDTSSFVILLTRVMAYGFGDASVKSDISINILSVTLAALMAILRDPLLSKSVSVAALMSLIEQSATALLDPRLSSSSSLLDPSTSKQLVKAINKLAIQSAIGSTRQNSYQALLSLQLKFCSNAVKQGAGSDIVSLNNRLSRIVDKLFTRVNKLEEESPNPFSEESIHLKSILRSLQDILVECEQVRIKEGFGDLSQLLLGSEQSDEAMWSCFGMSKSLTKSMLKFNKITSDVKRVLLECRIDPYKSLIARLLNSCEPSLDMKPSLEMSAKEDDDTREINAQIGVLVSKIGKASEGEERLLALRELQEFSQTHNVSIDSHLAHLSVSFRKYIMGQMKNLNNRADGTGVGNSVKNCANSISSEGSGNGDAHGMGIPGPKATSDRIRFLRSKLNETEASLQSAIEGSVVKQNNDDVWDKKQRQPSPSLPLRSSAASINSAQHSSLTSLKKRLATAQEKRMKAGSAASVASNTSSDSRTSALRARLEKAKRNSKLY